MSFRFQFQTPLVVECDSADDVLDLAEAAARRSPFKADGQRVTAAVVAEPKQRRPRQPRITHETDVSSKPRGGLKRHIKRVADWFADAVSGARAATVARCCDVPEEVIEHVLADPCFERYGKGFYRLADNNSNGVPAKAAQPVRAEPVDDVGDDDEPELEPDGDDDFEDPPRRSVKSAAKSAHAALGLVDKIKAVIRKEGPSSIMAVSSILDVGPSEVKTALRSNPDRFYLHPQAGGWRLRDA